MWTKKSALTWFSKILAFLTQNYFFSLSQIFYQKSGSLLFSKKKKKKKKSAYLVKFDIKNWFSDSFPFQKCILLLH